MPDTAFSRARLTATAAQGQAAAYNEAVRAANIVIGAKKTATQATEAKTVEAGLDHLQTIRKRHEPTGKLACQQYRTVQEEKTAIEAEKAGVKEQLDKYSQQVIGAYEKTINRLLGEFHAGFRITGTALGYPGGVASSTYQILINETAVDLGEAGCDCGGRPLLAGIRQPPVALLESPPMDVLPFPACAHRSANSSNVPRTTSRPDVVVPVVVR